MKKKLQHRVFSARFALPLDKAGGISGKEIQASLFLFRPICTTFATGTRART
ncbi:MAG: hypothetical protein J6K41_02185 [Paraprevotella sp.]|nr:hypothetical protein [Paraprevotella sp.]